MFEICTKHIMETMLDLKSAMLIVFANFTENKAREKFWSRRLRIACPSTLFLSGLLKLNRNCEWIFCWSNPGTIQQQSIPQRVYITGSIIFHFTSSPSYTHTTADVTKLSKSSNGKMFALLVVFNFSSKFVFFVFINFRR